MMAVPAAMIRPGSRERLLVGALLLIGGALRLGRFVIGSSYRAVGEAYNVAAALAQGRGFADAYRVGQGATAHVTPVTPAIAAAIYRLFGIGSRTSEIILGCWSVGLAMATYLFLYRAFARLQVGVYPRLAALAFLCVLPAYFWPEAVDFRIWDGGLTACLVALSLDRLLATTSTKPWSALPLALIAALLFLVNPLWGLAVYLCAAVYFLSRARSPDVFGTAAVAAVVLVAVLAPWVVRNAVVMDRAILLRSNAGLEIALAMHPAAVDAPDPGKAFLARLNAIHPTMGDRPFAAMRDAGGEATYSSRLGQEAWTWMRHHPGPAAILAVRHVRQAIFPDSWQFYILGGSERGGSLRSLLVRAAAAAGLLGLGIALARRQVDWIYPALLIVIPAIAMALFQPVQRYTYLFYPLLVFAATGCTWLKAPERPARRT